VGVERSADAVALARTLALERGLANVEVIEGDARSTGLARASFDLATARLVLVNVPQPEQIVAEAVALVRPEGWVAFHEADFVSHICDPASDQDWGRWSSSRDGTPRRMIDPFIGRKLPRSFRDAGLVRSSCQSDRSHVSTGHGRRNILLDFAENLSERIPRKGWSEASFQT
jgi:ubiquinone/menaquinone biosynthesis C-methylase UbiE